VNDEREGIDVFSILRLMGIDGEERWIESVLKFYGKNRLMYVIDLFVG
jgi:hypothetical protein